MLVFLTGAWATLQFRWLQRDSPSICLVLEKLLMGCLPIVSLLRSPPLLLIYGSVLTKDCSALQPVSVVLTWASLSAYGFDAAPFFLCAYTFAGIALW